MKIELSKEIHAPVERVFEVFSDISQIEQRISGITKVDILSDVKQGKGTRWRETRVMFGREATEEMEISTFNPNQSYEVVAESRGMKYHTVYTFTPSNGATRVNMVFSGKPMTMVAKLMTPLGMLMQGPARKALDADMDELKRIAEASS